MKAQSGVQTQEEAGYRHLGGFNKASYQVWVGILEAASQTSCSQASQLQQNKPPGCTSLIRFSNDLMHFLAASIKLNQVLMRLSFFRVCFVLLDALS